VTKTSCNVQRAREILNGKTDAAVYQMVARRQVPFRKLGRRVVFFDEELTEMLEQAPGVRPGEIVREVAS
jgi:predicted DNA-binding transcriptional regulator AlpA